MYIPKIKSWKLNNGLRIVLLPCQEINTIYIDARILFGSGHTDLAGVAHFLEHLVEFGATRSVSRENIKKEMDEHSIQTSALTSYCFTKYSGSSPAMEYKSILSFFERRLFSSYFSPATFKIEKTRIKEEIQERENDDSLNFLDILFENQASKKKSILARPVGCLNELKKINLAEARTTYNKFYRPDNTILMISAPAYLEKEIVAEVKKTFTTRKIEDDQLKEESIRSTSFKTGQKKIIEDPNFKNYYFGFAFPIAELKHEDRLKIQFIYEGLNSSNSTLQDIREKFGVYYIESDYFFLSDSSFVYIYGASSSLNKISLIEKYLKDQIRNKFFIRKFSRKTREKQINSLLANFESDVRVLGMIGDHYCLNRDILIPENMLKSVESLDLEDVISLTKDIFNTEAMNTLIIGPK
jgi:zinc protease